MISGIIRSMGTRNSPQPTSLNDYYFITETESHSLTSQVFYFTSQLFSSTKPCSSVVHFLSVQKTYYLAALVIGNMFTLIIHLRFY